MQLNYVHVFYFINYMEIILKLEIYFMYTSMMRINLNIIFKYIYYLY